MHTSSYIPNNVQSYILQLLSISSLPPSIITIVLILSTDPLMPSSTPVTIADIPPAKPPEPSLFHSA